MINKLMSGAALCAVLSSTALAGEIVIDISVDPVTIAVTPTSSNTFLKPILNNVGDVTAHIGGTEEDKKPRIPDAYDLNLGDVDGAAAKNNNNEFNASAAANALADANGYYTGNNLSILPFDDPDFRGVAEALIGVSNYNKGAVSAFLGIIDLQIEADNLKKGASLSISNNKLKSLAVANGQTNYIGGDLSALTPGGVEAAASVDVATGVAKATGDFAIAVTQTNDGTVDSAIKDVNMFIEILSLDATSTSAIKGNEIIAATEVNFLSNVINVENFGVELNIAIAAL